MDFTDCGGGTCTNVGSACDACSGSVVIQVIEKAIRDFPVEANYSNFTYGLDDLDYQEFVSEFAAFLANRMER